MLSFWKRLRADTPWVTKLLQWPDAEVREVTGRAVVAARQGDVIKSAGDAREMLRELPGFGQGTALASALLTAAAPGRLAVYDKHARSGLRKIELELTDEAPHFYARYMILIEQCRAEGADVGNRWSARDVDLALWNLGRK